MSLKMFENYPQPDDYIPDNRPRPKEIEIDEVIIGGTAIHTFALNYSFSEIADRFIIIYKQSITEKIIIDSSALGAPYEILELEETVNGKTIKKTYITVTLSSENTKKIKPNGGKLFAQVKLYLKDGSIVFANIDEILIKNTLEYDVIQNK